MGFKLADLKKLALEQAASLTLLEAQELKSILKDEYGIEPAAGGAVMMAGPVPQQDATAKAFSKFDVVDEDAGQQKVKLIKEIRSITGLGLLEAKRIVDEQGKAIETGLSEADAEEIKRRLEMQGATVEIVGRPETSTPEEYDNALAWATADLLALGHEAKRRVASIDETLAYVQRICDEVTAA